MVLEPLKKVPPAPKSLENCGKKHWRDILKILIGAGAVSYLDLPLVEMACHDYEVWRTSIDTDEQRKASADYLRIMKEYGATPKSRQNLSTPEPPDNPQVTKDENITNAFKMEG
jgi:phage terminase small subunit